MKIPKIPYKALLFGPWLALGIGFLSNAIVMGLNHGMPVLVPATSPDGFFDPDDWTHTPMTTSTHLKFLGDWIMINGQGIASPGDFGLWAWGLTWQAALAIWVALVIKDYNEK